VTPHEAFESQGRSCSKLGSPFMGQLMSVLAPRLARGGAVYDRINQWEGDITPSGGSVPLRVAGGLHHLVLSGMAPALGAVYPPAQVNDTTLVTAVEATFADHAEFFDQWLDSPPQTNEVRRAAVMIAAAHWLTARHPLPLRLSELGASAGLNLGFDHFALATGPATLGSTQAALTLRPDWSGPAPDPQKIQVADRRGVDLRPILTADAGDRLRLLSYLWPDQPDRLTMTNAAISVARKLGTIVDPGDAADWLEARLATPALGHLHLVFHTIAWQYFPPATAKRCHHVIQEAGARATQDAPFAWLGMEADGFDDGAAITLHLWPGAVRFDLGRVDFHGRWLRWTAPDLG